MLIFNSNTIKKKVKNIKQTFIVEGIPLKNYQYNYFIK